MRTGLSHIFMAGCYFLVIASPLLLPVLIFVYLRWRELRRKPNWRFRYSIAELWSASISFGIPAFLFVYNLQKCLFVDDFNREDINIYESGMGLSIAILIAQVFGMLLFKLSAEDNRTQLQ